MIHKVKILFAYFIEIENGNKKFEIRKNDRDYKVGDELVFTNLGGVVRFTEYKFFITYILDSKMFPEGLKNGYCVVSIERRR